MKNAIKLMIVVLVSFMTMGSVFGITKQEERTNNILKQAGPIYFRISENSSKGFTPNNMKEYTAVNAAGAPIMLNGKKIGMVLPDSKMVAVEIKEYQYKGYNYVGLNKNSSSFEIKYDGKIVGSDLIKGNGLKQFFVTAGGNEYEIGVSLKEVKEQEMLYPNCDLKFSGFGFRKDCDLSEATVYLVAVEYVKPMAKDDADAKKRAEEARKKAEAEEAAKKAKAEGDKKAGEARKAAEEAARKKAESARKAEEARRAEAEEAARKAEAKAEAARKAEEEARVASEAAKREAAELEKKVKAFEKFKKFGRNFM